ncbi:MAG: OB-fold domain-containing protein [Acidimicrobiia bacterium]|nr:OB-fold domain-containing protein [Acidimicrobiia bacterium]
MSEATTTGRRIPAVEGWFTMDEADPRLLGNRCTACGTVFFPRASIACRNPSCDGTEFEEAALSNRGRVWSYTTNHYAPPAPYMSPDPFEPYSVAAVELADEKLVVLGQVEGGAGGEAAGAPGLRVGAEVELVLSTLFTDDEGEHVVWKWKVVG